LAQIPIIILVLLIRRALARAFSLDLLIGWAQIRVFVLDLLIGLALTCVFSLDLLIRWALARAFILDLLVGLALTCVFSLDLLIGWAQIRVFVLVLFARLALILVFSPGLFANSLEEVIQKIAGIFVNFFVRHTLTFGTFTILALVFALILGLSTRLAMTLLLDIFTSPVLLHALSRPVVFILTG